MEVARSHGFPVPAVREVQAGALVLERIHGPTMGEHLRGHLWATRRHMRTLADLHHRLHSIPFDGGSLVHFDLHPLNVMISPAGPVVIDWTNAHGGDADADIAMTWLILETSAGLPGRILARLFRSSVGIGPIARGLSEAAAYRTRDPNVTDAEKGRVVALRP